MRESEFDGQEVMYIDSAKLRHSGVVVGESVDGAWVFCQSDEPNAPKLAWHFKVSRELMPSVLVAA